MVEGRARMRSARRKQERAEAAWDVEKRLADEKARKKFRKRCVVCDTIFYIDTIKLEYRSRYFIKTRSGKKWFCVWCASRKPERIIQMIVILEAVAEGKTPVELAKKVLAK